MWYKKDATIEKKRLFLGCKTWIAILGLQPKKIFFFHIQAIQLLWILVCNGSYTYCRRNIVGISEMMTIIMWIKTLLIPFNLPWPEYMS